MSDEHDPDALGPHCNTGTAIVSSLDRLVHMKKNPSFLKEETSKMVWWWSLLSTQKTQKTQLEREYHRTRLPDELKMFKQQSKTVVRLIVQKKTAYTIVKNLSVLIPRKPSGYWNGLLISRGHDRLPQSSEKCPCISGILRVLSGQSYHHPKFPKWNRRKRHWWRKLTTPNTNSMDPFCTAKRCRYCKIINQSPNKSCPCIWSFTYVVTKG